jgi:hypothetical protein
MRACFAVILVGVFSVAASAEIKRNKTAGVSIDLPRDWQIKTPAGDNLFASHPSGEAGVVFAMSDGTTIAAVSADVDDMLAKTASHVTWGPHKPIVLSSGRRGLVNGVKAISIAGTAMTGDVPVTTGVVILITPKKQAVFVLGLVATNREPAHRAALDRIARSLRLD